MFKYVKIILNIAKKSSNQIILKEINIVKYRWEFFKRNKANKAKLDKLIGASHKLHSNFYLNDVTLYPVYRKPFDLIAKGSLCSSWLP